MKSSKSVAVVQTVVACFVTWTLLAANCLSQLNGGIGGGEFAQSVSGLPLDQRVESLAGYYDSRRLSDSNGRNGVGGQGGATIADFNRLINLIQSVVDSNWEVDGGEDTIVPDFNGVWINSGGKLMTSVDDDATAIRSPRTSIGDRRREIIPLDGLGEFQQVSELRWVSLTRMLQQLETRVSEGKPASLSMELVGGLTRIQYVVWDSETEQWMLGGRAGAIGLNPDGVLVSRDTGLPPVLLQDLIAVASHVLVKNQFLGCSIDPQRENLAKLNTYLSDPANIRKLSRRPEKWIEEMKSVLGDQHAVHYGLSADSPTSVALLIADKRMKEVGLGLKPSVDGLHDYFLYSDRFGGVQSQSLVRWWFAFADEKVRVSSDGLRYRLPNRTVQIMSEQQWMDASGNRGATGQKDLGADNFALNFTKSFPKLRRKYSEFGRLQQIFDLALAMQIIREASAKNIEIDSLRGFAKAEFQPRLPEKVRWIDSVAAHRETSNGAHVAVVSGGVSCSPKSVLTEVLTDDVALSKSEEIELTHSEKSERWWQ